MSHPLDRPEPPAFRDIQARSAPVPGASALRRISTGESASRAMCRGPAACQHRTTGTRGGRLEMKIMVAPQKVGVGLDVNLATIKERLPLVVAFTEMDLGPHSFVPK